MSLLLSQATGGGHTGPARYSRHQQPRPPCPPEGSVPAQCHLLQGGRLGASLAIGQPHSRPSLLSWGQVSSPAGDQAERRATRQVSLAGAELGRSPLATRPPRSRQLLARASPSPPAWGKDTATWATRGDGLPRPSAGS